MKKILESIISFIKNIFSNNISVNIKNEKKYDIKRNKKCNIKINDNSGKKNENR